MLYTLEDLEHYGNRLNINTVLTIFVNTLAAYLILKHSSAVMGVYKYYILSTVIFAFLMDFHLTFIFGLFPIYPHLGGCPAGISKYIGHFWGAAVQYAIFHFTLTFCSLSIFFGFLYQYFSISNSKHFLQTTRGGICMALFMLIYPLPSVTVYFLYNNYDIFLEGIKTHDPSLTEFFISAKCIGFSVNVAAYIGSSSFQLFLITFSTMALVIKIVRKLSSQRHQMSSNTLKMRKQYFKVLLIQFFIPIVFLVAPILFLAIMILFNIQDMDKYNQLCFQFMSLHSVANALTIMFVIKSYRQILFNWNPKVFCLRKKGFNASSNKPTLVQQ